MRRTVLKKYLCGLSLLLACVLLCSCTFLIGSLLNGLSGSLKNRELRDFGTLTYTRPDYDGMEREIRAMTALIRDGSAGKDSITAAMSKLTEEFYTDACTMQNLSFITFSKDMASKEKSDEYYLNVAGCSRIEGLLQPLYALCAGSPYKDAVEKQCLGEGFLDAYVGADMTFPEELRQLFDRETVLVQQYSDIFAGLSVEYRGETVYYADISSVEDPDDYETIYELFLDTYYDGFAEIYTELLDVRNRIAAYYGYGSYFDYSLDEYGRSYDRTKAEAFYKSIRTELQPVFARMTENGYPFACQYCDRLSPEDMKLKGEKLIGNISASLLGIYREMEKNHLSTVTSCNSAMYYGSYSLYLNSLDAPYLFVNGYGDMTDLLIFMHEFGHYASAYLNYGSDGGVDEAEVASQALALLSAFRLDGIMDEEQQEYLRMYALNDIVGSLMDCALYSEFENLAYESETPSAELLSEGYLRLMQSYYGDEDTDYDGREWIFVNHLFEYPGYVISYSVSADVSLQILAKCLEAGNTELYCRFIDLAYTGDFYGNLSECGLADPMAEGQMKNTAGYLMRLIGGE